MPTLPTNEDQGQDFTKAITGAEWNDLIDYLERVTPRGDGDTTYAEVTKDGTRIKGIDTPVADGGGARLSDLPAKTSHVGHALVKGEEWNKLLNYVQMVTPIADDETATGEALGDGFRFSFPIADEEAPPQCSPNSFYLNVTVTGGTYPFDWLGATWTASGQTRGVCGAGTQTDPIYSTFYGYPIYTFAGDQDWSATQVNSDIGRMNVGGAAMSFKNPLIEFRKLGTTSPFWLKVVAAGFTWGTAPSVTSINTSNIQSYNPTYLSLWNNASISRINSAMFGSMTLTNGRVISWTPVPDLPWDYDNPPE